jgi:hypothetical protein
MDQGVPRDCAAISDILVERTVTPSRTKPGVAFWATVLVVYLPLVYVLSSGPALSLWLRCEMPEFPDRVLSAYVRPFRWFLYFGPDWAAESLQWYVRLWMPGFNGRPPSF